MPAAAAFYKGNGALEHEAEGGPLDLSETAAGGWFSYVHAEEGQGENPKQAPLCQCRA